MSPTGSASSTGAGLSPASRAVPRFSRFTRATRWARRMTFLVHRWLGIALALLMALWTLSGFVMMYVSYPATSAAERAAGLDALDLSACCTQADLPATLDGAAVEMVAGRPVLRWSGPEGGALAGLAGAPPPAIGAREAGVIALTHMRN